MIIKQNILQHPAIQRLKKDVSRLLSPYWQRCEPTVNRYVDIVMEQFDSWSGQKRNIFLTGIISAVIIMGYILIISPLRNEYKAIAIKTASVEKNVRVLRRNAQTFLANVKKNPNKTLKQEISQIEKGIEQELLTVKGFLANQTSASKMVQLIKNILSQNEKIKLLRIASIASTRVIPASLGTTRIGLEKLPQLYEHPIELDFEADYFETFNFLRSLEQSWRLYWDSIEYVVVGHPMAKVTVRIHLLSDAEVWDED